MTSVSSRTFSDGKEVFAYKSMRIEYDVSNDSYRLKAKYLDNDMQIEMEVVEPEQGGVSKQELDVTAQLLMRKLALKGSDPNVVKKGLSRYISSKEETVIRLDSLLNIDKVDLVGKIVSVQAVVSSNTISYNVPKILRAICHSDYEGHNCLRKDTIALSPLEMAKYLDISRRDEVNLTIAKRAFTNKCYVAVEELETETVYKVRLRPNVLSLEVLDGNIVDEIGNEYKHFDVFVRNKTIPLEAGTIYQFVGTIISDPKTQKVSLFAHKVLPTTQSNLDVNAIRSLKEYFLTLPIDGRVRWISDNFKNYSKIVNRSNIAILSLLTFFTPRSFYFDRKIQRGWLIVVVIGDSTTAKSETEKQLIRLLRGGQLISGETATTAGIAATATQTANGNWFVDWGPLVLNDLRLLVVDGAHKLRKDEWATLAEAQRSGIVRITKAAKNEGYARTRQILIMNPLSEDRKNTVTVRSFYYPCKAIESVLDTVSIARLDMTAFVSSDVQAEDINKILDETYDSRLEHLAELLKLVWLGKYEVVFSKEAIDAILRCATELYNKFYIGEIPLCSIDMKYKIARLATSLASLTCNFNEDFSVLTVDKEHVEYVVDFIDVQYSSAGLDSLAKDEREGELDKEDVPLIIGDVKTALKDKDPEPTEQQCKDILLWIARQTKFTRDQLKGRYLLHENNELRPLLSTLQTNMLITNVSKGFRPTRKLIELARVLAGKQKTLEGGYHV